MPTATSSSREYPKHSLFVFDSFDVYGPRRRFRRRLRYQGSRAMACARPSAPTPAIPCRTAAPVAALAERFASTRNHAVTDCSLPKSSCSGDGHRSGIVERILEHLLGRTLAAPTSSSAWVARCCKTSIATPRSSPSKCSSATVTGELRDVLQGAGHRTPARTPSAANWALIRPLTALTRCNCHGNCEMAAICWNPSPQRISPPPPDPRLTCRERAAQPTIRTAATSASHLAPQPIRTQLICGRPLYPQHPSNAVYRHPGQCFAACCIAPRNRSS